MSALPLLVVQAAAPSDFERVVAVVADVATIVIALAIIMVGAVAIFAALKARAALRRAKTDLHPAIRSLTTAAAHVEAIGGTVRQQVDAVGATVQATTEKVQRATTAAEHRLGELNVLLGAVQREADEAFVKTAAAVRGVQAGAEALRRGTRDDGGEGGDGGDGDEGDAYDGPGRRALRVGPPPPSALD